MDYENIRAFIRYQNPQKFGKNKKYWTRLLNKRNQCNVTNLFDILIKLINTCVFKSE